MEADTAPPQSPVPQVTYKIQQVATEEIPLIAGIDRSEWIDRVYDYRWHELDKKHMLVERMLDEPKKVANWDAEERRVCIEGWVQNMLDDGAFLLGAYNPNLVGISLIRKLPDDAGELLTIFVDRQWRRAGYGSQLLDRAELYASVDWGCDKMILYTGINASTLDFYLARGYKVTDFQQSRRGEKNAVFTMVKPIAVLRT